MPACHQYSLKQDVALMSQKRASEIFLRVHAREHAICAKSTCTCTDVGTGAAKSP